MSLSKIGKLTSAFSSFKNNPLDLTNMATALASVGNVDNAAKYLVKINKQNGNFLGENAMAVLLSKAYRSSGINQEMAMGSINNALANSSKFSMGGMLGSLSAVGTGIATMFESIAPVIIPLIIAAVAAKAGKMAWDNFATNTAAKKQYQTSSKAYQEAASERDSVQSEYDSNKERIQELRAKANRTVDESKELSNLQSQNDLLNSQLSVKNQIADTAQKQAALDAKTALEKGSYRSGGLLNMDYDSDLEHASDLMHEIQVNQYRKSRLEKNRSDYSDSYWSDYQKEEREIANYDKTINSQKSDLSDLMTTISDTSQDFWDEQGNLVDESTRDTANKIKELANDYTSITGVSDIDSKMNNLFARSQFKDVKDQLLDIGKKQGSKGIESKIDEIDGLKSALDDAGISIDDFTSELMAMADPDAKNLEGIKENLKDIFGEIQDTDGNSLYDFFKDKSNKDIEGYYDYFLNQGLNPQTSDYTWKKEDIENSYNDYLKSKEKTNPESTIFSSLFKNSAEDTSTDLDTITDNFQTDMSNIKSAMDSIKSGTFQNSDITDLIQQFPELATETDNLQQGLQKLTFDKASTAIGKIRDSVKDVTDPKELAAANKYIQSIMDTMDLSNFDVSNSKHTKDTIISNLKGDSIGPIKSASLINQLFSEYGNDKVAMQAIMKLSLDPSMANADLDTWKSKIEDTKVQIQLDTSAKNLDNLSKELTRLQTDASDQQTRLNNKSAYNMKATASDYTNLIENGDKQIENLNNQIQEYQNSIDALKNSKGLSPLSDEDNEQIKQYQDQIQAANMSIENMKASQADWRKTAFNLPVTDMQNTVTALTSAISEMQTETGLTSDTMDSLRTQFSDLKDAHVDNVFDRTAKGLKINTERMKDYLEQQNEFMNSDFAQRIQDYQDQLSAGNKDYTQQGLENLKNLQAQYFAQYQEAAKQFSDFQAMVNADNLSTEGNEYTTAKSYLDNAKDLYDKGLVGTPQFKAAAKYFSQNGFEDADNFIENYNKLKNYYTDDTSGPKRFLSDLEAKGLATYKTLEDGNQQWMYSFTDTQEAADAMGMSLESFESMFGRLKDYGDTNNFVSSLEEGALKSEEIDDKLIDAQIKMGKLKASGANQSALDDQQAVIDNLIAQKTGITQAISDFKDGTVDRKIQDIKDAKGSIDELNQYIKDNGIDKDSDLGKKYIESIQEQAKKAGIKLTPEFEVDEAAYNKMIQGYEAKAKGQKIKHFQDVNEGIESGNTGDYTDSDVELVNKIKDAQDKKSDNYKQLQDLIQTLNKENPADLAQIQLGNGAYESEDAGIRGAEDALQGFADQLDLTQEQANALLTVLQALGEVKVQPEMSEELKEMQKNKGSVDLAHRPVIDASELSDMGYQNVGDGTATVFSSGYSTDDGKKTVVVTPILPNGDVLEPEALDHYANEILETGKDTQGIGIRTFEGDDSIQQANNYAEMLHQVQQAYYGEDEAAKQSLETLKDYSAQELMNIDYTDGQYSDNERYANAEKSVDSLIDSYKQMGMSEMEAQAAAESLIMVMDDMGLLKVTPEVDTSGIDELDQATQDGMASLRQMKADGDIDLSFEIDSSTDGLTIDELQSQIDELEKAKVKLKLDVDSPEYNAIQSMIDQRETQIHLQVLMDQSTDIDKWLALANGEDGDKQLAIAAGIDLNDEDNGYRFDLWAYDMDTQLGINNSGELSFPYGKEDTDYKEEGNPSSGYVFNAAESVLWCRIRDIFTQELRNMYQSVDSNCWSDSHLINEYEAWQNQFPEELWRIHYERLYLRTYRAGTVRFLKEMMNGRGKYHLRQWERDQHIYMGTKFLHTDVKSDQIMFRCNTPKKVVVKPDYTLKIIPYSDMYISVLYGNSPETTQVRAKAGQEYQITTDLTNMDDTAILIYAASRIEALNDLSACYIHDNDFSKASKLKTLIIGNNTAGYQNTFMTSLNMGNNTLLETLDIRNCPNLTGSVNLSACENLINLYADGTIVTSVLFANHGKIAHASLPSSINTLTLKNLKDLTDLKVAGYDNLQTFVCQNSIVDALAILNAAINTLRTVTITGISWNLDDTTLLLKLSKLAGIDDNGATTEQSILTGSVHIPVVRQQEYKEFVGSEDEPGIWTDLVLTYDSIITQFKITFINDDESNTILDIQYVDKGGNAVDPTTREVNPIPIPTKKSTIKLDYTFKGWEGSMTGIFADRTITAVYDSKIREYTVKYVSKGLSLQESTAQYGSYVKYTGDTPVYTAEESAYKYNLFKGWDKSGFVDGNKTINAVYETCEYVDGYFDGKDLANMTQVELYTLMKMGLEAKSLSLKDTLDFKLGVDYSYGDIEEHEVISAAIKFDGTNYIDTGLKIMEKDRDFTIAIDFEFDTDNSVNSTLAQCFQGDGSNGFRLWYSQEPRFSWNTDSITPSAGTNREIIVFRHEAGSQKLYVYNSNMTGKEVSSTTLNAIRIPENSSTLVFGCSKADDGAYENFAKGTVHWAKVWYADLGEEQCMDIASWIHEIIPMEVAKFKGYYLSDVASKRANITFVASNLLGTEKPYNNKSTNAGGWADSTLNTWLNTRMVKAISPLWKALIKPVKVYSSVGNKSNDTSVSNCRFYVPSLYEVDPTATSEPYISETNAPIAYFTDDDTRKKAKPSTPAEYESYWTRSPNVTVTNWIYTVNETGSAYGFSYPGQSAGILLMFSISCEG